MLMQTDPHRHRWRVPKLLSSALERYQVTYCRMEFSMFGQVLRTKRRLVYTDNLLLQRCSWSKRRKAPLRVQKNDMARDAGHNLAMPEMSCSA